MLLKHNESVREQVIDMRRTGLTYAEIGRKLGLTRERIRQIANHKPKTKKRPAGFCYLVFQDSTSGFDR